MNHTLTPYVCNRCAQKYNVYGGTTKHNPNYEPMLKCEECSREVPYLMRFRIPEKNIIFNFISSYQEQADYYVLVDGKEHTYYSAIDNKDIPLRLRHQGAMEWRPGQYSFAKEEFDKLYKTRNGSIWWEIHDEIDVPRDIQEAFEIMIGHLVRRTRYVFDGWDEDNEPINARIVEY